jgi:L,D-transpeptidase catalytic domain
MGGTGRHASRNRLRFPRRLGITAVAASLITVAAMIGAIVAASSGGPAPVGRASSQQVDTRIPVANAVPVITKLGPAAQPTAATLLTAADHQDCPAAAAACVDLARHITWLQHDGRVTFGPVQMEPGQPGSKHQTPLGTFQVAWKAGPSYQSNVYHEAMPWATFFGTGGIAFHGGSLTAWSHGCVHLTDSNAHYYNEHLPVGAEVVVF